MYRVKKGDGETMRRRPITKPGQHGTLYRYRVTYRGEERDPAAPEMSVNVWAYDEEHAHEKVASPEEGWETLSAERLYER